MPRNNARSHTQSPRNNGTVCPEGALFVVVLRCRNSPSRERPVVVEPFLHAVLMNTLTVPFSEQRNGYMGPFVDVELMSGVGEFSSILPQVPLFSGNPAT